MISGPLDPGEDSSVAAEARRNRNDQLQTVCDEGIVTLADERP